MAESFGSRFKRGWNAFFNRDPTDQRMSAGAFDYYRPDRVRFTGGNERTIATSVYNRIAMDAAAIDLKHVRLDDNDRYAETIKSSFNDCLSFSANVDQTGRAFKHDIYASILDEGCIAIVPTDTDVNPKYTDSYKIGGMRTAKILTWRPDEVQLHLYNERTGKHEDIWLPKRMVAIVENPLYAVINERNSTMQRLVRKLAILDAIDEQSGSGKLDMIIQLPYSVRSESQKARAEDRRKNIETQLNNSKYGIAYADSTERITQLNRPLENNLMKQIEYLTNMLYSQLGITQTILDGTADEKTMLNYYTRTIEPLVAAVADELERKFISKTARTQGQSIMFFRDPFSLAPVSELSETADKMTRNEIMTKNEFRQIIGLKPSDDPKADMLINSNLNHAPEELGGEPQEEYYDETDQEIYEEGE